MAEPLNHAPVGDDKSESLSQLNSKGAATTYLGPLTISARDDRRHPLTGNQSGRHRQYENGRIEIFQKATTDDTYDGDVARVRNSDGSYSYYIKEKNATAFHRVDDTKKQTEIADTLNEAKARKSKPTFIYNPPSGPGANGFVVTSWEDGKYNYLFDRESLHRFYINNLNNHRTEVYVDDQRLEDQQVALAQAVLEKIKKGGALDPPEQEQLKKLYGQLDEQRKQSTTAAAPLPAATAGTPPSPAQAPAPSQPLGAAQSAPPSAPNPPPPATATVNPIDWKSATINGQPVSWSPQWNVNNPTRLNSVSVNLRPGYVANEFYTYSAGANGTLFRSGSLTISNGNADFKLDGSDVKPINPASSGTVNAPRAQDFEDARKIMNGLTHPPNEAQEFKDNRRRQEVVRQNTQLDSAHPQMGLADWTPAKVPGGEDIQWAALYKSVTDASGKIIRENGKPKTDGFLHVSARLDGAYVATAYAGQTGLTIADERGFEYRLEVGQVKLVGSSDVPADKRPRAPGADLFQTGVQKLEAVIKSDSFVHDMNEAGIKNNILHVQASADGAAPVNAAPGPAATPTPTPATNRPPSELFSGDITQQVTYGHTTYSTSKPDDHPPLMNGANVKLSLYRNGNLAFFYDGKGQDAPGLLDGRIYGLAGDQLFVWNVWDNSTDKAVPVANDTDAYKSARQIIDEAVEKSKPPQQSGDAKYGGANITYSSWAGGKYWNVKFIDQYGDGKDLKIQKNTEFNLFMDGSTFEVRTLDGKKANEAQVTLVRSIVDPINKGIPAPVSAPPAAPNPPPVVATPPQPPNSPPDPSAGGSRPVASPTVITAVPPPITPQAQTAPSSPNTAAPRSLRLAISSFGGPFGAAPVTMTVDQTTGIIIRYEGRYGQQPSTTTIDLNGHLRVITNSNTRSDDEAAIYWKYNDVAETITAAFARVPEKYLDQLPAEMKRAANNTSLDFHGPELT